MGSEYYFGYYFYAPTGRFAPCGMFTLPHIAASVFCAISAIFIIKFFGEAVYKNKEKAARTAAAAITLLEVIKIAHSFIYGETHLDAWFPLSYCGLFIFALWILGFGKGFLKSCAEAFIEYGCPVAAVAFLIFPTTSLMSFPVWHYFSVYSLLFHTAMLIFGIIFFKNGTRLTLKTNLKYDVFIGIFAALAVTMNYFYGCNLMNMREPYNIPIKSLQDIYTKIPPLYTFITAFAYSLIPGFMQGLRASRKIMYIFHK